MFERVAVCSTTHMTKDDALQMEYISMDCQSTPWVYDAKYGFIVDLGTSLFPLLLMKKHGLSKPFRKFAYRMINKHGVKYIHLDCDASVIEGEVTFEW